MLNALKRIFFVVLGLFAFAVFVTAAQTLVEPVAALATIAFVAICSDMAWRLDRKNMMLVIIGVLLYALGWRVASDVTPLAGQAVSGAGFIVWFWAVTRVFRARLSPSTARP